MRKINGDEEGGNNDLRIRPERCTMTCDTTEGRSKKCSPFKDRTAGSTDMKVVIRTDEVSWTNSS